MSNPCHHSCDWTDEPDIEDHGCCVPAPVRKSCESPVLPVPDCDEVPPEMVYDPETETFSVVSVLYDENCSPILDHSNDEITTLMS